MDLINRQDAIDAVQKLYIRNLYSVVSQKSVDAYNLAITQASEALENFPSAERKGHWIDVNGDGSLWRCDQCKDTACCKGDYCPNCGADMRYERRRR